jgi:hypothetical protein
MKHEDDENSKKNKMKIHQNVNTNHHVRIENVFEPHLLSDPLGQTSIKIGVDAEQNTKPMLENARRPF